MLELENFTAHGIRQLQKFERENNNTLRNRVEELEARLEVARAAVEYSNKQLVLLAKAAEQKTEA